MDLDLVADKEVDKLANMVAGLGCWLIGPKHLSTRTLKPMADYMEADMATDNFSLSVLAEKNSWPTRR